MSELAKQEKSGPLMPSADTANLPELFVINLCASMAPMPTVPKALKGFEKYKLYQVSRQEDGRRRFRLRLGFFTTEADADWVLNSVRGLYPAAFTGCVSQEDLRYAVEMLPAAPVAAAKASSASNPTGKATLATSPASSATAKPAAAAIAKPAAAPASASTSAAPTRAATPSARPTEPGLSLQATPAKPETKPESKESKPFGPAFHVARGIQVPETNLELTDEYEVLSVPLAPPPNTPRTPTATPAPKAPAPKVAATSTNNSTNSATAKPPIKAAASPATVSPPVNSAPVNKGPIQSANIVNAPRVVDDYVPILDTTLTIRTLTKSEAEDPNRPKWFAVQLAVSEKPINLDTMPKLDIFAAYSLYCVALMEEGNIKHALRLGFFRENVSAEAVMGYLKAFFQTPNITQISAGEYERFAESKPKPKPAAEPENKVVNLTEKRPAAPVVNPAPAQTAATRTQNGNMNRPGATRSDRKDARSDGRPRMSTPVPAPARPQSFLSRLIGRQLD